MRRLAVLVVSSMLLVVAGCGKQYVARMDETLKDLKYQQQLNDNLEPGPGDGDLKKLSIWVRAPKGQQAAKAFSLATPPEGQFDVETTYQAGASSSLHVLARKKQPKKPPAKGAAPAPDIPRNPFVQEVLALLNTALPPENPLTPEKFKAETKRGNQFKFHVYNSGDKTVQVYLYQKEPHDVALIYVFDTKLQRELASRINYSLGAFAVGAKADRYFGGATSEEDANESGAPVPL